jgi:hypothetical protein
VTALLTIYREHDTVITLHDDAAEARRELANFARSWWRELAATGRDNVPADPTRDDEEAIRVYFSARSSQGYRIDELADLAGRELVPAPAKPARREHPAEADDTLTGRVITPPKPLSDAAALNLIQEWLRDPEWGVGMLEDIACVVKQTGRTTENYPDDRPTWNRH